jgi:hypothetical protein
MCLGLGVGELRVQVPLTDFLVRRGLAVKTYLAFLGFSTPIAPSERAFR